MKKLITSFLLLLAFGLTMQAQVAWDSIRVTPYPYTQHILAGADTVYFSMINRSTGRVIGVLPNDSITGLANDVNYQAADSVVWSIVKGAALGTAHRVRFINVKTGKYLYVGTKGGTTKQTYLSPLVDPYNGVKEFSLTDKGQRVNAEYYYNIVDYQGSILNNLSATATIGFGAASNTGTATYMFRFYSKKGPLPKATIERPTVDLIATNSIAPFAGGSVDLKATITKGSSDLLGQTLLYYGTTLIDTMSIDANGVGMFTYSGLKYGNEKFAVVYTGDAVYGPEDKTLVLSVGPDPTAKPTKVELSLPTTAEVQSNVTLDVTVKTSTDDIVPSGKVNILVNGILKNTINVDVLGMGSVTFPNFLVGTENIKAVYIGDKMGYLDSDTASISIDITPSTATVKPYPVYFDLCDIPEIRNWERDVNITTATVRPYSHSFALDSLSSIVISDTLTQAFKVTYNALGSKYDKLDNCYNRANNITLPIGLNRPRFIKFKTPWLNEGSYNVYISHRITSTGLVNITSVTMDGNELYFPGGEMYNRILSSYNYSSNTRRRWNAAGHSGNMAMNYLGSVRVDQSNTHSLQINVDDAGYNAANAFDMLEFIPVDQDSLSINETAAVSLAKIYYPMFSWTGIAYQPGYDPATVATTYADFTNFGIVYQAPDQTDWGTTYEHTIDSVGLIAKNIGGEDYFANYVTVYRAEDQWTRVSEGYSDGTAFNYVCNLPKGDYYYEAILYGYIGLIEGAVDYRTFINSGTFTVTEPNAVVNQKATNIKTFAFGKNLTVKGIQAGAKIIVSDLTGRIVLNTVSKSDTFTKALYPSIYLVKVISNNETLTTKVIVK